jgi:hypothetical protein
MMHAPVDEAPPFDAAVHGGGLTETQRAERVVAYDEPTYGFVRMAVDALRDAGVVSTSTEAEAEAAAEAAEEEIVSAPEVAEVTPPPAVPPPAVPEDDDLHRPFLERLHATASSRALAAVGPKHNPFLTPLQNTLRKSAAFQSALHAFVKHEVCPALGVSRVAYQRRPTFRVHLVWGGGGG